MKKILLLSAVLAVLSCQSSFAVDTYVIPYTDPAFKFYVYNQGESIYDGDDLVNTSVYTMTENQLEASFDAAKRWDYTLNTIIDADKLPTFAVTTIKDFNAYASSGYVPVEGSDYLITTINAFINNKTIKGEYSPFHGDIFVGVGLMKEYPGWNYYTGPAVLYQADLPDIYTTMAHEMYHAIGLTSNARTHIPNDNTNYFSKDTSSPISIWDKGLRIYKGSITEPFDSDNILAADRGMSVRVDKSGNETFDIVNNSPYFAGLETLKVLTGLDDTEENLQAYIHSKGGLKNYSGYYDDSILGYPKVLGLPVNVIEEGKPELSHLELRNSFMSHQSYQNWAILMEAELAVLKDIGYSNVELRKFFGKSYYLDNITDTFSTGYGNWNGTYYSGYSNVPNGVGLHIYGSENNITQTGNTLSNGRYTIGTRIDGTNNIYTLNNSLIDLAGDDSIGIAAAWGKGHHITIDSGSDVVATGENSIGVSLDFGKNIIGGLTFDEGSYSSYDAELKQNTAPDEENQGALVETLNVDGSVRGTKAAIYISENAYVKGININNNSHIIGNIISKWNSVKSGENMSVLKQKPDGSWRPINAEDLNEILFTGLNFSGNTDVKGNIDGTNDILNTLQAQNTGVLNFSGDNFSVYSLNNTGTINFSNMTSSPELNVQYGSIGGNGTLIFQNGIGLKDINYIENTVDVGNSFISLLDRKANQIAITKLNSDNADLYIDYGDSFTLQENSDLGRDQLTLKQLYVDDSKIENIITDGSVRLFEEVGPLAPDTKTLDVASSANFYYKNNKYTLAQDSSDKTNLLITKTEGNYELADAIEDASTANYVMSTDEAVTKDLGTVKGGFFEISGDDIDVAGHSGLVADGSQNSQTILRTSIYGASDSNITLSNKANLLVKSDDDDINIGKTGEIALTIDNSTFEADLEEGSLNFGGKIKGLNTNSNNSIILSALNINLSDTDNVAIATKAETINLNNALTNTIWEVSGKNINILNDSYLSSDGTNMLIYNGGLLNLANNKTSDIHLKSLTLNTGMDADIDIDLDKMLSDKFVFADTNDLQIKNNYLNIENVNIMYSDSILTDESYAIPFVSSDYKNTNFLGRVRFDNPRTVMTPIFKYNFDYDEISNRGDWMLSRGSASDYESYNPSVLAGPVAAQIGGYLTQLNSYDEAFRNMDMYMLMTREQRQALKFKNRYAASDSGLLYDSTLLRQERAEGWFRPYATFEKVGLNNGPEVENQAYGSFMGAESQMYDLGHGWDGMWGVYVGYNGSHQNYNGVSIYQNGGTLGLNGMAYKGNFFTGLTVNTGANAGDASTMYGNDNFAMLMAGIASKTGYNFEFAKGKFIIQPNWLMSYSFVNTFDYTNAAGVRIDSDPLHAIQLQPELKFIGNLKNGWQPYASVAMVWNILDDTKFKANDISMPEMSVRPYVKYGVGIRKTWGERFTGFFQTYITNGGRNGVGLSAGFTWAIGKDSSNNSKTKKKTVKNKA